MTRKAAFKHGENVTFDLSINHYLCGDALSFTDFAAAVRSAGVDSVGITRAAIAEMGLADLETCLADNGLTVSSLNSAGYFTIGDPNPVQFSNESLIEAAARLNADVLCVIAGGLGQPPLPPADAHKRVADGLAALAERAATAGVTLGLEPIYPGDLLTKGCINSCAHGLEIVARHPNAKLILDLYHSWWDPDLPGTLQQQADKVALVQLCNLRLENGLVAGRDRLRDGALDLSRYVQSILSSGYTGKLELELFSPDLSGEDPHSVIRDFPTELRHIARA